MVNGREIINKTASMLDPVQGDCDICHMFVNNLPFHKKLHDHAKMRKKKAKNRTGTTNFKFNKTTNELKNWARKQFKS